MKVLSIPPGQRWRRNKIHQQLKQNQLVLLPPSPLPGACWTDDMAKEDPNLNTTQQAMESVLRREEQYNTTLQFYYFI